MNNLIIAAHPDDEVLGCGGTIARLTNEGKTVFVAILGEGMTSRYGQRNQVDVNMLNTLKKECKRVSEMLGVKELILFDLPDNCFDTIPLLNIVKIIESIIDKVKPSTIFTHSYRDLNIDHQIVHRATLTATRPITGHCVKNLYAYEVPSSTEWAFHQHNEGFRANVFIDIGTTLEKKIKAMELYKSEIRSFPHPRSSESLRYMAKRWGATAGFEAAEAFELIREIR